MSPASDGPADSADRPRRRIAVFAFACDPEGGSEKAAGWGCVQALAETADLVVLVHPRHLDALQRWERDHGDGRVVFEGVPTVAWGEVLYRFRPLRRVGWLARYVGWQHVALQVARDHHRRQPFDAAIHVTLGMFWLPSTVVDLPVPSVWGPVGGAAASPRSLWPVLGVVGVAAEFAELLAVKLLSLVPATRRTWDRATVRLVETESARGHLPRRLRPGTEIVNRAVLVRAPKPPATIRGSALVFSSPLEVRKGPALALRALTFTPPGVRLLVIHEGPEEAALRRLAARLGVADRVEFRGRVPRDEMFATMAAAAACVFTGLREEGGAALAEAMQTGTPVIVLGWAGARVLAEASTDPTRTAVVQPGDPRSTARRLGEAMARFSAAPPTGTGPYLDQHGTRRALQRAVERAITQRDTARPA